MANVFKAILNGHSLSGLRAGEGNGNGLVLALHGGGYTASYWHAANGSPLSLLNIGAGLGYDVLAVDRPGYAGSGGGIPNGYTLDEQAELMFALIDRQFPLYGQTHRGRPIRPTRAFLWA